MPKCAVKHARSSKAQLRPAAASLEGTRAGSSSPVNVVRGSSVQITFHEDMEPERHAMPPGGFRLAVLNAWDLQSGVAGRELLRSHFLARAA